MSDTEINTCFNAVTNNRHVPIHTFKLELHYFQTREVVNIFDRNK